MTILEPVELRMRGFQVLCEGLGYVNAVRFVQQYEKSTHDYVSERDKLFEGWTVEKMMEELRRLEGRAEEAKVERSV